MKLIELAQRILEYVPSVLLVILSVIGAVSIILKMAESEVKARLQLNPASMFWLKIDHILNFEVGVMGAIIGFLDKWIAFNRDKGIIK